MSGGLTAEGARLPSSPQTLCFNKEDFMKEDFNVEQFVMDCKRKVSLDVLRNDLHIYLKILQNSLIELINKDYADFVNLSTNLVGMDKAINSLLNPLNLLKMEIMNVRNVINEVVTAVEEKLLVKAKIAAKKENLQNMMAMIQCVNKMEKLLGIQFSTESHSTSLPYSRELNGQLVERVATEFNRLQFYVNKSRGLPLVEELKPRIGNITEILQHNLEGSLREGLSKDDPLILVECLRTYASIEKMRDAELFFRTYIVKDYMEQAINENNLKSRGLRGIYESILDFFPRHCSQLLEITSGVKKSTEGSNSSMDRVGGYDFVVNAVWPEVVSNIEAKIPSIFAPGNPNVFHERYMLSMEFIERFELRCSSQASVKRLRSHPSYTLFMSKWSLPVYFQIRFQEIGGAFESSLMEPFTLCSDTSQFQLAASRQLFDCLNSCWSDDVYLPALCHRFWKLSLQLISRYSTFMTEVSAQLERLKAAKTMTKSDSSSSLQQMASRADSMHISQSVAILNRGQGPAMHVSQSAAVFRGQTPAEENGDEIKIENLLYLVADCDTICKQLSMYLDKTVLPKLTSLSPTQIDLLRDGMLESETSLRDKIPMFVSHITTEITSQCVVHLKVVSDIPRLYRRTNREMPTKPSSYVLELVEPIKSFRNEQRHLVNCLEDLNWVSTAVHGISEQYLSITTDVLTAVKKMEESLKRLKAARGGAQSGVGGGASSGGQGLTGGASDDDKIRQQLLLDVNEYVRLITELGVSVSEIDSCIRLQELVKSAISPTHVS